MSGFNQANRVRYNACVEGIERDVLRMGQHVLEMVELAAQSAIQDDPTLVDRVLEMELETDQMEHNVIQRVIRTQAMEGPVAHDALLLSAAIGVVTELEKMGDEATKLGTRVRKLGGEFPYEMTPTLHEMTRQVMTSTRCCLRLFTQFSGELADEVIAMDDAIDRAYKLSRSKLLDRIRQEPEKARQFLRCAEVFHALEHIADHAVDMAKRLRTVYEPIAIDE